MKKDKTFQVNDELLDMQLDCQWLPENDENKCQMNLWQSIDVIWVPALIKDDWLLLIKAN